MSTMRYAALAATLVAPFVLGYGFLATAREIPAAAAEVSGDALDPYYGEQCADGLFGQELQECCDGSCEEDDDEDCVEDCLAGLR